ncbi:MAG: CoA-binding protein [Oligoflexia bacterium]|nr:CoA-binding protein [Oligoflexia bacterium]
MDDEALINEMLAQTHSIAVVGLSDRPERSSYSVSEYMARHYQVVPVNPAIQDWLGMPSYASILSIPAEIQIDLVNVFRRSEYLSEIVEQIVARNRLTPAQPIRYLWTQLGVEDSVARSTAEAAGLKVIMNQCIAVAHSLRRS